MKNFFKLILLIGVICFMTDHGFAGAQGSKDEYLVQLKSPCSILVLAQLEGFEIKEELRPLPNLFVIKSQNGNQLIHTFKNRNCIEFLEANTLMQMVADVPDAASPAAIPRDPQVNELWYLQEPKVQRGGVNAYAAWQVFSAASDQVIAVIDSGVDYRHPDLANKMWINTGEVGHDYLGRDKSNNQIDDDQNGFIDDVLGWNFNDNNNDPMDQLFHGTHCAGTIGAEANNNEGIAGIVWQAKIMALRFLGPDGQGTLDKAVKAILYAADNGATVISASWGSPGKMQSMELAIEYAHKKGVLFVAAAGNNHANIETREFYPAAYQIPNIITVAATNEQDELAPFSNFSSQKVHLAAPGTHIFSTVLQGKYDYKNGTSMATPIVAGAVALMRSYFKGLSHIEIKELMLKSTDKLYQLKDKTQSTGRLNIGNAIYGIFPQPDWPREELDWLSIPHNLSTPHPLVGKQDQRWSLSHVGAKYLQVHFSKIDLENAYDLIYIYDSQNRQIELIHGPLHVGSYWSQIIPGDRVQIRFRSQLDHTRYGFDVDLYRIDQLHDRSTD